MRGAEVSGVAGTAYQSENLLRALNALHLLVEQLKGQKSVLLFSESGFSGQNSIQDAYAKTLGSARRSNVAIYAIDPGGLDSGAVGEIREADVSPQPSSAGNITYSLSSNPDIKGFSFEAADSFLGGVRAYQNASLPLDITVTFRTDEMSLFCEWEKINNPNFKVFYASGGNYQSRIALTAAMMKLKGYDLPSDGIILPTVMRQLTKGTCNPDVPQEASVFRKMTVEQNLMYVVRMAREAVPSMKARGGGSILNITAISAIQPIPGFALSVATWSGVIGFSKTLSLEVAEFGISVNTICPGYVDTTRLQKVFAAGSEPADIVQERLRQEIPLKRIGTVDDIANAVALLVSPKGSYITGAALQVDGGQTTLTRAGAIQGLYHDCDDADACTVDTCNPASGCVHTPVVCTAAPCTLAACDPTAGIATTSPSWGPHRLSRGTGPAPWSGLDRPRSPGSARAARPPRGGASGGRALFLPETQVHIQAGIDLQQPFSGVVGQRMHLQQHLPRDPRQHLGAHRAGKDLAPAHAEDIRRRALGDLALVNEHRLIVPGRDRLVLRQHIGQQGQALDPALLPPLIDHRDHAASFALARFPRFGKRPGIEEQRRPRSLRERVRSRRLELLNELTGAISRTQNQGPMLQAALEKLKSLAGVRGAWFAFMDGQQLIPAQHIGLSSEFLRVAGLDASGVRGWNSSRLPWTPSPPLTRRRRSARLPLKCTPN